MKHHVPDSTPYPDETMGRFWIAGESESAAQPGLIRVDQKGALVHLDGSLAGRGGIQNKVVFGKLRETGQPVTLFNTFTTSIRYSAGGEPVERIESTLVAFGCHAESLTASAIQFRLPYCASWFHEDTFHVGWEESTTEKTKIRFEMLKMFSYELLDGFTLERRYSATVPGGNWGSERLEISRPMSFKLSAPNGMRVSFDTLWDQMRQIQRFFEFLSRNRMPPTHLALWIEPKQPWDPDVLVYATDPKKAFRADGYDDQLVHQMDITSRLGEMLKAWGQLYKDAPDVIARYFSAFDRDGEDPVLHFLWNAVAMEELHKVDTGDREKPGFLGRLQHTVSRWHPVAGAAPDEAVLKQIRDTRNYYAHGAGDLREKAAKDWVLLRQAYFLEALATLEMLRRLGFSEFEVAQTGHARYWIRENLSLRRFPTGNAS